ncbi:DUF943 family protein [Pantoea sp. FN0302]|uniref:DUF943 family protein n=1 Tax=Pantoea sp. FN0302 TaxID=3418558 RepID=UPI003CFA1B71
MIKYKISLITLSAILLFILYQALLPVEIIGVHKPGKTLAVVIVKNFPLTRVGKISWWKQHQRQLQEKHPFINSPENHIILFLQTEYKKDSGTDQDSDLLCFKDMPGDVNCVSKENRPLLIWHYPDGHTEYETENFFQRFLRHF